MTDYKPNDPFAWIDCHTFPTSMGISFQTEPNFFGQKGFYVSLHSEQMFLGLQKKSVLDWIALKMQIPGTVVLVTDQDRYKGRFIAEAYGLIGDCDKIAISRGMGEFYISFTFEAQVNGKTNL